MKVAQAIREAALRLSATSETARLDAELLMANALGVGRSQMLLRCADQAVPPRFCDLVTRREAHEPVAYILGEQEFFGRTFKVTPDTLIPRSDSESVVQAALDALNGVEAGSVLDLGTGTGALLLTLLAERPDLCGRGIDRSDAAIGVARQNAEVLGLSHRASFEHRAWFSGLDAYGRAWEHGLGPVDLVIANPPYVETTAQLARGVMDFEPHDALFAGPDGLDDYRILIPGLARIGCKVAVLEIGATQAEALTELAEKDGFRVQLRRDLANRPRALILS